MMMLPFKSVCFRTFLCAAVFILFAFPVFAINWKIKDDTRTFLFVNGTSGNVGVASLTPRALLDVNGGMVISGLSTLTGGAVISDDVTIGTSPAAAYPSSNADVFVQGNVESDGTLYGYGMMLSSGNTVNAIVTTISSPTNLQIPTAAAVTSYVATQVSTPASITSGDTTVIVTDGGATGQVAFKINGSTSMIVDQNGNVGIGTSVPASRFAVMGAGTATNKMLELYDSGKTSRFVVLDNGNVGIGVAAPAVTLDVNGGINISGAGNNYFTSNVGIGSTVPRSALDVSGTASVNTVVLVPPAATVTVTAAAGVSTVASSFIRIVSNGGAVTVTAVPPITITGIADGQELILLGTSNTNTVQFTNAAALKLQDGVSFTMNSGSKLMLIYSSADTTWMEISRSLM